MPESLLAFVNLGLVATRDKDFIMAPPVLFWHFSIDFWKWWREIDGCLGGCLEPLDGPAVFSTNQGLHLVLDVCDIDLKTHLEQSQHVFCRCRKGRSSPGYQSTTRPLFSRTRSGHCHRIFRSELSGAADSRPCLGRRHAWSRPSEEVWTRKCLHHSPESTSQVRRPYWASVPSFPGQRRARHPHRS